MTKRVIYTLIVVVALGFLTVFLMPTIIKYFKNDNNASLEIMKLKATNDSLSKVNDSLFNKLNSYTAIADSFYRLSLVEKEKIVYIKTKQNEKIRSIDNYSGDQIDSLFTNTKFKAN